MAQTQLFTAQIQLVDDAIGDLSGARAQLGAYENVLTQIQDSISVVSEQGQAARGRIMDVDVASEMANFTKNQILTQSGTSMLAQANSLPQNALSLLGG